ncbi:hypothetical protein [Olleya sp. R77988]|uniref:hypothetical protein n=1 Tax=Olleya sp. R77988 TaxID=3093875 RepID=UPI0037CCBB79
MKKIVFLLFFLIISIKNIQAHNPLSAMYYLEVKEDLGILNISLSQTGLNEALKKHYSSSNVVELSAIEYKQLAVRYLKENFNLNINGETIVLSEGGIKLGNHQTDAKFIVKDLPKTFKTLNIDINAFKENKNHQTVFSVLLNGNTSKVVLNKNKDYTASVVFKKGLMVTNTSSFNTNYLWFIVIIPVFLFGKKIINKKNKEVQ